MTKTAEGIGWSQTLYVQVQRALTALERASYLDAWPTTPEAAKWRSLKDDAHFAVCQLQLKCEQLEREAEEAGRGTEQFNVGDVARLRSGGPLMTVVEASSTDEIYCKWYDEHSASCMSTYPSACLVKDR